MAMCGPNKLDEGSELNMYKKLEFYPLYDELCLP